MSTIKSTEIVMHVVGVTEPFILYGNASDRFGILKIKMNKMKMTTKPLFMLFTIDKTGSMNEISSNGTTKLDYVKQTFTSMLTYLSSIDLDIYIKVNTFNTSSFNTIDTVKLTKDNLDELVGIIKKIYATDSTDLGIALQSAKTSMLDYISANPDHEVVHIFMTDGEATTGETSANVLCDYVDDSFPNIFVGFGFDHNATMLRKFSDKNMADYQFVDNMENTALIYGETIHRFLYPAVKNVRIDMEDGVIYNWRTNQWTNQITEDVFVGEIEKLYHIKTSNPESVVARLFGNTCGIPEYFVGDFAIDTEVILLDTIYTIPPLINTETYEIQSHDEDLTKYMFRQRVQELLYAAKNVSVHVREDIRDVKEDMKNCFRVLHSYMRTNNMEEDPFLKQLCEDIYITYRTIGTRIGHMYSSARQATQGMQRTYTNSRVPQVRMGAPSPLVFGMRRQNAMDNAGLSRNYAMDEFDDFRLPSPLNLDVSAEDDPNRFDMSDISLLEDQDDLDNYVSVETNVSCYSTPTVVNTMRSVSAGRTDTL